MHSSDQIKCSLVQEVAKTIKPCKFLLTHKDGLQVSAEEIDIGQTEWPYKIPKDKWNLTWKFIDHTPDMSIKRQIVGFQTAFNSIEKVSKLKIDYQKDLLQKTDVTVEWLEDIESFNNKLSVLAHAYFWSPNGSKNGVMEFNDSPNSKSYFTPLGWPVPAYLVDNVNFKPGDKNSNGTLIMRASQPTTEITMHEFGHVAGLQHDLIHQNALMYPYVHNGYIGDEVNKQAFEWQLADVERWHFHYEDPGISQSELFRWRDYRTLRTLYERY